MNIALGIKIISDAEDGVLAAINKLQEIGTRGLFTPTDQMIIPLVEINNVDHLSKIKDIVKSIKAYPFSITLDRIDHHGAEYWIELIKNEYLTSYARYLYERLRSMGFDVKKRSKNVTPHVVISRKTVIPRKTILPGIAKESMEVKYIHAYKVKEENDIPVYSELLSMQISNN